MLTATQLLPREKRVLWYLHECAQVFEMTKPSIEVIAEGTFTSKSTVIRALSGLEEKQIITRSRRRGAKNMVIANSYRFTENGVVVLKDMVAGHFKKTRKARIGGSVTLTPTPEKTADQEEAKNTICDNGGGVTMTREVYKTSLNSKDSEPINSEPFANDGCGVFMDPDPTPGRACPFAPECKEAVNNLMVADSSTCQLCYQTFTRDDLSEVVAMGRGSDDDLTDFENEVDEHYRNVEVPLSEEESREIDEIMERNRKRRAERAIERLKGRRRD